MASRVKWTRERAVHYLQDNWNFQEIRRKNRRIAAPSDLSTAQARRYARGLWLAELDGREVKDLSELRGHLVKEGHKGRKPKPLPADWRAPEKVPRGWFAIPQRKSGPQAVSRTTSGEGEAVRALSMAALGKGQLQARERKIDGRTLHEVERVKGEKVHYQVQIVIQGPRPQENALVFGKGGYDPRKLLEKAGYERVRGGGWRLKKDGMGLEQYLLNYLNEHSPYVFAPHVGRIRLYQLFFWPQANPTVTGVKWDDGHARPVLAGVKE